MVYIFCFIISAGFAFFASKAENRKNFYILSFFSIAVMVALAGFRDYTVGIDTYNYLKKAMYWGGAVSADSLWDYFKFYFPLGYGEPLFAILVGVIAQLTGNFTVFLIVCHTIILVCVYIGIFRFKEYINPAFVVLLFYMFAFNYSLNIIRQYIAIAIVFAFLADIQEGKYLRYCLAVIVAMLFHTTAIISLGILILYFLLYYKPKIIKINIRQRKCLISGFLFIGVLFFNPIINTLIKIGVLNSRYGYFLQNKSSSPAIIVSAIAVLGLLAADFFREQISEKCKYYDFYFMCSVAYLIILQLTYTVDFGKRISLYFSMADLITLGLIESSQKNIKIQRIVRAIILFVVLSYWVYSNLLNDANKTLNYVLSI